MNKIYASQHVYRKTKKKQKTEMEKKETKNMKIKI